MISYVTLYSRYCIELLVDDGNDNATFVLFDREMLRLTKQDAAGLTLDEVCDFLFTTSDARIHLSQTYFISLNLALPADEWWSRQRTPTMPTRTWWKRLCFPDSCDTIQFHPMLLHFHSFCNRWPHQPRGIRTYIFTKRYHLTHIIIT